MVIVRYEIRVGENPLLSIVKERVIEMASERVVTLIQNLLAPIMKETNFELVDVEFVKEGQNWVLRIFLDKEGGIAIDDCELVSRKLEKILDEKNPIEQAYMLEVSSPGIDRPLKKDSDYVKYAGEIVDIKLYKAINKMKEYQGKLVGLADGIVTIIDAGDVEFKFEKEAIAVCRLAVFF